MKLSEAENIFNRALEIANPEERAGFVKGASGANAALRDKVESLLKAHEASSAFLATDPGDSTNAEFEGPGSIIGRYKLLQKIGEGGMGVVYMAEQSEPVRRTVALKIIKIGMDTRQVVARFEAERQALALMDHPNIAKVLDAGATDTGRPFFVMELVRGVPVTDYCDKNKLSTKERLELFIPVCQAIQHAHQKGIIHRDIKPSNVMVTLHDGTPVPKVIDFGIAKATNQRLTEKTLFTNYAQMIGTPAYMSPEQAEMSGLDIDTRTDVYSLGVLLYELLTGTTPFPQKELLSLGYGEMQRIIAEKEPQRPSTRLSTMTGDERTILARNHNVGESALDKLFKGDLDWIVMKALEKDRTHRYESASGLSADIKRHLNNEPISAAAPTFAYQFQKFYRRNRPYMRAAATVATLLLIAAMVSVWQAIRATRAKQQQTVLRQEAEAARTAEANQRSLAEQRVYDSLVREARAVRLARRVGYRDQAFALLQQAARTPGAQKDFAELRREAVASLGDFVGRTPITFTNWPSGFFIYQAEFSPAGDVVVFRLGNVVAQKHALIVREIPSGKELVHHVSDRNLRGMCFTGTNQFIVFSTPSQDDGKSDRKEKTQGASITLWSRDASGAWREGPSEPLPGVYDCQRSEDRTLVVVDDVAGGTVNLLDLKTRAILHRIKVSQSSSWPSMVRISLDGRLFAVQTATTPEDSMPEIAIWNLEEGREVLRRSLPPGELLQTLDSNGKHLITFNSEKTHLTVYDTQTLEALHKVPDTVVDESGGATVLPNHNILVLPTFMTREVRFVDYLRQEVMATLNEPRSAHAVSFSADGRMMMVIGVLYARLYDLTDEKHLQHLSGRPDAAAVAFHPSQPRMALVGKDGILSLRNTETGNIIWELPGWKNIGLSAGNDTLLLAQSDRTQEAFVLSWRNGERLLTVGTNASGFTHDLLLSSNGRYLITSSSSTAGGGDATALFSQNPNLGSVSVWELTRSSHDGEKLAARRINDLVGKYCSFTFLGSSARVAFIDYYLYPSVYTWDISSPAPPKKLPLNPRWGFGNLVSTRDGRRLWMIDSDGQMLCADSTTGERIMTSNEGMSRMDFFGAAGLSISEDGSKLAVLSNADRGLEIFDALTGRLQYHLPSRTSIAASFAWASDNQRIVANSWNGDVAIWNLTEVDRTLTELGLDGRDSKTK